MRTLIFRVLFFTLLSAVIAGCDKKPRFAQEPNPLPNYISDYYAARKVVFVQYCRLINPRLHRAFQGIAKTKKAAKEIALERCALNSSNPRECYIKPKFECAKRKQLRSVYE